MLRSLRVVVALIGICPLGAAGATLESTTLKQTCRNIADKAARLACYDARFGLPERSAPDSTDHVRIVRETREALSRNWLALTPYKTNYVLPYTR